jgi:hypothetical protein
MCGPLPNCKELRNRLAFLNGDDNMIENLPKVIPIMTKNMFLWASWVLLSNMA